MHAEILGGLGHGIAVLGDERDRFPFKIWCIPFPILTPRATPPLTIIALFEVSIATRPLHFLIGL